MPSSVLHLAFFPCLPLVLALNLHHSPPPGLCEEFWGDSNEQTWGQSSGPQHVLALTGHTGKRRATQIPTRTGTPSLGSLWSPAYEEEMFMHKSSPAFPLSRRSPCNPITHGFAANLLNLVLKVTVYSSFSTLCCDHLWYEWTGW